MRLSAILLFLILPLLLVAAEIREGSLYLEISLAGDQSLNLRHSGNLYLTDASGLLTRSYPSNLTLGLSGSDAVSLYGITALGMTPGWEGEAHYITRSSFAWQDSALVLKDEMTALLSSEFDNQAEAIAYADANGIARSRVIALPMSGAGIQVRDAGGGIQYFESPLKIFSSTPMYVDSGALSYTGEFVVKAIGGRLQINHVISLENYLAGVIQNEIGSGAPLEALKAQAVAARSHAISLLLYNRHRNDGFDICNGTHCQVYKGEHLLNDRILEAVLTTGKEVITYNGRVIDATYHSACGGKTDASNLIWRGSLTPYLMGVTCIDEADELNLTQEIDARRWIDRSTSTQGMSSWERASQNWNRTISSATLASNVGLAYVSKIEILQRGVSGRILSMKFTGNTIKMLVGEYQIRRAFGSLPSSLFYIDSRFSRTGDGSVLHNATSTIRLKGKGSGHGVGMCQVGALRLSREGTGYRDILGHYYPGTEIRTDWLRNYESR